VLLVDSEQALASGNLDQALSMFWTIFM